MFENMTLYEAFKVAYKKVPNETAIYYQGTKISFNKLHALINKVAATLVDVCHIKKGDTVLISQPNIPHAIILYYAVNKIGGICNFVHPFTPYNQLKSIIDKTNVKVAFVFEQRVAKEVEKFKEIVDMIYVTRVEDFLPPFKKFLYHTFLNRKIRKKLKKTYRFKGFKYLVDLKSDRNWAPTEHDFKDDFAVLLHSGSTTGEPKTIMLSNWNFNFLAGHALEYLSVNFEQLKGGGMLSVLPSFHGFGLLWTMHAPIVNGFASILIPKFSPKAVVKAGKDIKMIAMCGVPTMYDRLVKNKEFQNLKQLKYLITAWCGGDAMNVSLEERFNNIIKRNGGNGRLFEGYGLTESIAAVIVNTFSHYCQGSIGYPGSGVEVKIVDENRKEVKVGELGEIAIKSPSNMIGYYNDKEATESCMDKDGWLYSGDLGYMNKDGFIFYKQRIKRVIKISGVATFPSEVEKLIETVPGVLEVSAISIPDPVLSSAIKVFVVAKFVDEEGMRQQILDTCRKYLIKWAVPKEIEFRKSLPHTMIGKIDFKILQQEEDKKRKEQNETSN